MIKLLSRSKKNSTKRQAAGAVLQPESAPVRLAFIPSKSVNSKALSARLKVSLKLLRQQVRSRRVLSTAH